MSQVASSDPSKLHPQPVKKEAKKFENLYILDSVYNIIIIISIESFLLTFFGRSLLELIYQKPSIRH